MGNFGKSRLRKGISIVASMVLLLSSIMPTVPVFAYDPQPEDVACVEGGSCYDSLPTAISNTAAGGTIILVDNIELNNYVATSGINIDLNGHTVLGTNNNGIFDCYGNVTISDSSVNKTGKIKGKWGVWGNDDAQITIDGVNIEVKRIDVDTPSYGVVGSCDSIDITGVTITSESYGLNIWGSTQVTVANSTINATNEEDTECWGIALGDTAELEINGDTAITSIGYGISTNGNAGQNATIVINGGNINGAELGIYQPSGTVTINGGQIQGETAIYQKAGNLTIKDATLIANGAANAYNYWGNGGHPTGDGIVVDSCAYPGSTIGDNPNLTILDGVTINSANGKQVGYYEANTDKPGWSMGVISSKNGNLTLPGSFVWIEDGDVFKIGYTVNFNCGEGCDIEDGDVLLGNTITKPDAPDGYTIDKWYKDSEKTDEWIFDDVVHVSDANHVNGVITLYATKATISYTIKYNLDGGINGTNPENYTIESDDITLASPTKDEYDFDGWYSDENFTKKIVEIKKGSTGNVELWAKWNKIEALPTGEDAITATGENNAVITAIVVDNDVPATDNPTDQNDDSKDNDVPATQVVASGFTGQVKGGISVYGVAGTTTGIENIKFSKPYPLQIKLTDTTLTGVYLKVKHGNEPFGLKGLTTKSDATCGDDGSVTSGAYNGEIVPVSAGGIVSFYTCSASTFVAYTETPNPVAQGGGGGGSSSSYSCKSLPANAVANNTSKPKKNTYYSYSTDTGAVCTFQCKTGYTWNEKDAKCEKADETVTSTEENTDVDTTAETTDADTTDTTAAEDLQKVLDDGFTVEFHNAYEFAFKNGITTMPTIQEADMEGSLNRIAMAKMLSNYAINILGKVPADVEVPAFLDVDQELADAYDDAVAKAYKLGIMGINMPDGKFRPYDTVTRAEFGTALSRMLFGLADGEGDAYYSTHLEKLMSEGIITNDNPRLLELRGYVMIMLMRSANK